MLIQSSLANRSTATLGDPASDFHKISDEPTISSQPEPSDSETLFKYGCKSHEMESFWEKLDRKEFVRVKLRLLGRQEHSPDLRRQAEAEFLQGFGCSYFGLGIDHVDLNEDGVSELFVKGETWMRDGEELLFRESGGRLKMILFKPWNIEKVIGSEATKGLKNIRYMSNWTGGDREIVDYAFDGRVYRPTKCFDESHFIEKHGEMIQLNESILKPLTCDGSRNPLP